MSVYPHAAGFLGLPAMFRVMAKTKDVQPGQSPHDGPIDIQLATSSDGVKWNRTWPRMNVIPRGKPGSFDGGAILGVSSTAVDVGDHTWVYYTGLSATHGAPMGPKKLTIGRAEWRRHGFVSLDADPAGCRIETRPLRLGGGTLLINADATRGELRVCLLEADGRPITGFTAAQSDVLRSDATQWPARWDSGTPIPQDRDVRIVVEFSGASLYSVQAR
jgi:hypothetical protein